MGLNKNNLSLLKPLLGENIRLKTANLMLKRAFAANAELLEKGVMTKAAVVKSFISIPCL